MKKQIKLTILFLFLAISNLLAQNALNLKEEVAPSIKGCMVVDNYPGEEIPSSTFFPNGGLSLEDFHPGIIEVESGDDLPCGEDKKWVSEDELKKLMRDPESPLSGRLRSYLKALEMKERFPPDQ